MHSRSVLAVALTAAVALLAGCSSTPADPADAPAVFATQPDFQPGVTPPCLVHQTEEPNPAYQGGEDSQSVPQLTFLAYYTAAGKAPFCDGQPASDTDKAWAQLYDQLTGSSGNVTTILG